MHICVYSYIITLYNKRLLVDSKVHCSIFRICNIRRPVMGFTLGRCRWSGHFFKITDPEEEKGKDRGKNGS